MIESLETHRVPALNTPIRLQEYGVGIFQRTPTKSALKKVLKQGLITVNNQKATTATFIKGGEEIKLTEAEQKTTKKKLILPLKVLYEDDYLAVIHKPAGILVSGNGFKTVTRGLPQNLAESQCSDATLPQPVHRLDYGTTGVLLVGKTSTAIRVLNQQFETKEIDKTYYAITIGKMNLRDKIDTPIEGKSCQTYYEVVKSVASERFDVLNLVKLTPLTGRRHQLRIHLSSNGNPLLGDKDYGIVGKILTGKGIYLHAYTLEFIHPYTKKKLKAESPLPEKFSKIFASI